MTEDIWLNHILNMAKRDPVLAGKIQELYKIDSLLVPKGGFILSDHYQRMKSAEFQEMMHKSSTLCDEIAEKIAESHDDRGEIAEWISYNIATIARELAR